MFLCVRGTRHCSLYEQSNQSSYVHCRVPQHTETALDGTTVAVKHCHDNSHAQEDREREKKVARKRLCLASVICLIFMVGEILGESRPCFLQWSHLITPRCMKCSLFIFVKRCNLKTLAGQFQMVRFSYLFEDDALATVAKWTYEYTW